jgi:hypothetical protein
MQIKTRNTHTGTNSILDNPHSPDNRVRVSMENYNQNSMGALLPIEKNI